MTTQRELFERLNSQGPRVSRTPLTLLIDSNIDLNTENDIDKKPLLSRKIPFPD